MEWLVPQSALHYDGIDLTDETSAAFTFNGWLVYYRGKWRKVYP